MTPYMAKRALAVPTLWLLMGANFGVPVSASAQLAEERGLAIAREADRRDAGWHDLRVEMEMVLRNREGQEARRRMNVHSLEIKGDGDKSLILFDTPRDMNGTALLTHSHKTDDDDQWLFLPALKRVKRISGANKSGSFVGSEFAYEDLTSQEVERYTYRYLRDEPCGSWKCFVVDRSPVNRKSGYTRQTVWIDKTEYRPVKVVYYDRKESVLKTLTLEKYQRYLSEFWRPHEQHMENHQTGRSTTILYGKYEFRPGLSDQFFKPSRLRTLQ